MLTGYLKRTCVRVVLFAHVMQILTPAVQASDTDYQYRVHVRTLNQDTEKYQVEVSRRKKDKSEPAQVVQRLDLEQGQVKDHFIRSAPDGQEVLYGKFAGAVVKTYEPEHNIRFVYNIPGLGQVQMLKGGKAFLTQDAENNSLALYDLAVKSTGVLLIDRLKVAGLVLRSKMTELDGQVSVVNLRVKHQVVNRALLKIRKIMDSIIENFGLVESEGLELKNSKFVNHPKAELKINGEAILKDVTLDNQGTLSTTAAQGKKIDISQVSFGNKGAWHHRGDLLLRNAQVYNEGEVTWRAGTLAILETTIQNIKEGYGRPFVNQPQQKSPGKLKEENFGTWLFDEVACKDPFVFRNNGTLHLSKSSLNFRQLHNYRVLILESGTYLIDKLSSLQQTVRFIGHDWCITDKQKKGPQILRVNPAGLDKGSIFESEKALRYDVDADFYKLTSGGDVTILGPKTLYALLKASTPGKMTITVATPPANGIINLDLPNIGYLVLNFVCPITRIQKLVVPALDLQMTHPLVIGTSNEDLGTIAATKGALDIKAPMIDGKYGKIYGAGPTKLKATNGNIIVGASREIPCQPEKRLGWTWEYTSVVGNKYASCTVSDVNGAYVASGSSLDLEGKDLQLSYGQTRSVGPATFTAEGAIDAIRSIIRGDSKATWKAKSIHVGRAPYAHLQIGWMSEMYWNVYGYAAKSDETEVNFLDTILFDTPSLRVVGSTICSGKQVSLVDHTQPEPAKKFFRGLLGRRNVDLLKITQHPGLSVESYAWKHAFAFPSRIMAADAVKIDMGNFSVTGSVNSPWFAVNVPGSGFLGNGTRSRCEFSPTERIVVNLTEFIQERARRPGFMRIDNRGAVENEFPMGMPFIPANGDVVLLQHPGQQPIRKFPINMGQFFNPICSIDLDLHIQQILAMRAGQVYAGEAKGNQLSKVLWNNAGQAKTARPGLMTEDELANSQRTMLLMQPTEDNTQVDTVLVINPRDVNPFQSDGDLVTNKLDLKVGTDLTLENNRIVVLGEEDTEIEAGRDVNMRTTFHTNEYDVGKTHVVEQVADPQQMILKPNGNLKVKAGRDMNRTGSHIEAGGNADLDVVRQLHEQSTLMQKTATTREKKSTFFSSSERTETTLTHSALPTTAISGKKLTKKAGAGIHSTAPQDSAGDEIHYDSPDTVIEGLIALNRHTSESSKSNGFTEQSTRRMQESAFGIPANLTARKGVRFSGKAKVNANITTATIHDETVTGVQFVAKVVEVLSSGQSLTESPLCSVDAGFKAGYETMIPCMLMVEKIIRTKEGGQMLFESVLMDDKTEIIGAFVKTTYELKNWHTSWCHVSQVVPNEVIIAAALAITILTKGAGAKVLAPMIKGVAATTGMALSPIGITMVNAGYSAFCAAATSHFLRNGDPIHIAQQLVSLEQLKSIGISMASAGLCDKLGSMLDINMAPGIKEFSMHLKEQALRASVDTVLNVAINQVPVDEALCDAVKQIPLKAVAAYTANQICLNLNDDTGVKAAHTLLGGLTGFAMEGNRDGLVAGATGALTAQVVGDILLSDAHAIADKAIARVNESGLPMTGENIEAAIQAEVARRADLAKIAAGGVAALLKKDPNIALFTAGNTMDNDITIRQSIYVMAELQKLLEAAAMAEVAKRFEEPKETSTIDQPELKEVLTPKDIEVLADENNLMQDHYKDFMPELDYVTDKSGPGEVSATPVRTANSIYLDSEYDPYDVSSLDQQAAEFNMLLHLAALIPNPVGVAAYAGTTAKDIYQAKTTVAETLFNAALGYGILKGIQWTGKGIKFLYQNGKEAVLKLCDPVAPVMSGLTVREKLFGTNKVVELFNSSFQRVKHFTPYKVGPLTESVAGTFRSGTYTEVLTRESVLLYRVYGGSAKSLGQYWTWVRPSGQTQAVIDYALLPAWGNTAQKVSMIRVPAGEKLFVGIAAEQAGEGATLVGGGLQVFLEAARINPAWLMK